MQLKGLLFLVLVPILFTGCGSGSSKNTSEVSKLAASQGCMDLSCHGSLPSPGTGAVIAQEWLASTHNTKNGAGCADCHEPDPGHPDLCNKCHGGGGFGVTRNPDAAGKCGKCHGLKFPQDVMLLNSPKHFGNMTASLANNTYRASYVNSNNVGNCRQCHNPHDTSSAHQINADWADSAHGQVSKARTNYDFKTRGTYQPAATSFQYYCVRCHTTTGYVNFVASGFTDQRPFAGPGFQVVQNAPVKVAAGAAQPADKPSPDKTKEVTACNACHDDGSGHAYGFAVRAVPAVQIYYNFSSANSSPTVKLNNKPVLYPNAGASNLCLPCHTGRGIGSMIYDAASAGMDFRSTNGPGAHDRAAGATLFQKGGYEFTGRGYASPGFQHGKTGVANYNGTGTSGPCVACHMNSDSSHSFLPVTEDGSGRISAIISKGCARCHNANPTPVVTPASLQAGKEGFAAALAMLNVLKNDPALPADPLNPGKSKVRPLANKNSDYDAAFPAGGANTMGAFFNASLLQNELGAFAHNSLYTRRLVYDSIDWLNNGILDDDVESAINNAALAVNSKTGKVSLSNPIMGGSYIASQVPGPGPGQSYDAAFAKVKLDAVNYLLGGPGGARP